MQVVIDVVIEIIYNFNVFSFVFCFRELNEVVHRIVKWVFISLCNEEWVEFSPN